MANDRQLLSRFAAERSESAFGELVTRYLPLVYSTALRQGNGNAHLAQDAAQMVFSDLARKAPSLSEKVILAGWLHRATIFAARHILRGDRRRRLREQQAATMNAIQSESESADWQQIRPILDEALDRLDKTDRDALLLRFFEQQSLAQIGTTLGSTDEAARKRIARALEKLRAILQRRGVATTAVALSTVISANAMQTVPAGLAATLTNASFTAAGTGTTLTLLKIMTATQIKFGLGALIAAGVVTAFVVQHQAQARLRAENQSLQQQMAQLQTKDNDLSNRLADAGDGKKMSDNQFNELLRLRGEVGVLRRRTNELGDQIGQVEDAARSQQTNQLSSGDQFILNHAHVEQSMEMLSAEATAYAQNHNGQCPTDFNQLTNIFTGNISLDDFEFVDAIGPKGEKLVLRSRAPIPTVDGRWEWVYGGTNNNTESVYSDNENAGPYDSQ